MVSHFNKMGHQVNLGNDSVGEPPLTDHQNYCHLHSGVSQNACEVSRSDSCYTSDKHNRL